MGSFNPLNFILFNTQNVLGTNAIRPAIQDNSPSKGAFNQNMVNVGANMGETSQSQLSPSGFLFPFSESNKPYTLSPQNQAIISTVEIEQRANYVKELLHLPKDFKALINMIETGKDADMPALSAFSKLLVDGRINLSALTSLLASNSKEAVQKLMMTIMNVSKMGAGDVSQLKELITLFQSASANIDPAQMAKSLILLYLPWLPLAMRNDMNLDFDIDFFDKVEGVDPDKEEAAEIIKIMIQTVHFGNVLATLERAQNHEIDILLNAAESFPEEKVIKRYKENFNVRTNVTLDKAKDPSDIEKTSQDIQVVSSNYVSPNLLLAAHALIKVIIDVDYENSFIKKEDEEG